MYLVKTPNFIQSLFPNFVWKINTSERVLYLTFDDGPIPEVTPWVLDQLSKFNASATFFCVGDNIRKYPQIFEEVKQHGHAIGNHTFNHLSGWITENIPYYHNVRQGATTSKSDLFRPPYGRLKRNQAQFLQRHYKIIMWDVLSGDFDQNIDPQKCYFNVIKNTQPGSIIVFHDSLKAEKNLRYVLPKALNYFQDMGYRFESLNHLEERKDNMTRKKSA